MGSRVGAALGFNVGIAVGAKDGLLVGWCVGDNDEEGTGVGENDGACFAKLSFVNRNTKPSEFETRQ